MSVCDRGRADPVRSAVAARPAAPFRRRRAPRGRGRASSPRRARCRRGASARRRSCRCPARRAMPTRGGDPDVLAIDGERAGEGSATRSASASSLPRRPARSSIANSSPPKRARKSFGAQTVLQALRHELDQLVAGMMAERVVDVLEAVDVEIGGDGAIVVGRQRRPCRNRRSSRPCARGSAVRTARRAWLRAAPGLSLGQLFGGAAKPPQHRARQHAGGEDTEGHQRQDDSQQHLARALRCPVQISDGFAVIADERLGDHTIRLRRLGRQRQIVQQQRMTDWEMKASSI